MIALGESNGELGENETIDDLNEENIPYFLARFYLSMTISNYITEKS